MSITWLGTFTIHPGSPSLNNAYYNSIDKKSYIYDGTLWQVITQDGVTGDQGIQGTQGIQGIQGNTGLTGQDGISVSWLGTLITAPASPSMNQAYYNSTDKKSYIWNGLEWQIISQDGINGTNGSQGIQGLQGLQGIQGTAGINGYSILNGLVNPTSQGVDGDFYINTSANTIFGPKTAGAWGSGTSLIGPQGIQGNQGPAGTGLTNKGNWLTGTTYVNGDYVFDRSTGNPAVNSMWICQTSSFLSTIQPYLDATNWVEFQAPAGPQGIQGIQGNTGANGISVSWQGTLATEPGSPTLNMGYYNSTDKKSYIYNGTSWQVIAQDGVQGIQGIQGIEGPAGNYTAGTGIDISGGIITSTLPDQTITLTGTGSTSVTGTYPNFTVSSTDNNTTYSAGTGLTLSGTTFNSTWTASGTNIYKNNSGYVGIGITNPSYLLHVDNGVSATGIKIGNTSSQFNNKIYFGDGSYVSIGEETADDRLTLKGSTFALNITNGGGLGTSGQVLKSNGTTATWTTDLTATPGGISGYVQFNNSSAFGGSINLFWDNTNNRLGIGTSSPQTTLHLNGSMRFTNGAQGLNKVLTSDANGNATWSAPAIGTSTGTANYIPKFTASNSLANSEMYQNGTHIGVGTTSPSGKFMIQQDATAPSSEPIFEIKDKTGQTVMVIYQDSAHFFVKDPGLTKTYNRGSFAVSGKSQTKSFTSNYFFLNPSNNFIGQDAGFKLSGSINYTGKYNSFIGYQAGYNDTVGSKNYFIGYRAGYSNSSGYSNIFIGDSTGFTNTYGIKNIFLGNKAGYNSIGDNNVFLGTGTGSLNSGDNNVFLGTEAGYSGSATWSVFIGYKAGYSSNGFNNVFIGDRTGSSNTSGYGNTCIGARCFEDNTTGRNNTSAGYFALQLNTTGRENSAIGYSSLAGNITGNSNCSYGYFSMVLNTGGSYNTASGFQSLYNNTTGNGNTGFGLNALYTNTTGTYNTALGYSSDVFSGAYTNTTALGYDATCTAGNQVRVGNNTVTSIGGYAGWTTLPSDKRFKKDINESVPGLSFITKLRPVTYFIDMEAIANFLKTPDSLRLKDSESFKANQLQTGFIAQEVEKAAQDLGFDFSGVDKPKNENDFYGLRYSEFTVPLVKAVQELNAKNEELQKINSELIKRIEALEIIILKK